MFLCKIFLTHFDVKSDLGMYFTKKWSWGTFISRINQTNTNVHHHSESENDFRHDDWCFSIRTSALSHSRCRQECVRGEALPSCQSDWGRAKSQSFPTCLPPLRAEHQPRRGARSLSLSAPHRQRPLIKTRNSLSLFLSSSFARRKGRWGHFERVSRCRVIGPRRFRHRPSDAFDVEFIQLQ